MVNHANRHSRASMASKEERGGNGFKLRETKSFIYDYRDGYLIICDINSMSMNPSKEMDGARRHSHMR